jgi:hypothetical protein
VAPILFDADILRGSLGIRYIFRSEWKKDVYTLVQIKIDSVFNPFIKLELDTSIQMPIGI